LNEEPQARMKITRSGKGVLITVPLPELGVSKMYITSKVFLEQLLAGTLKRGMLGCTYLGDGQLEQFMNKKEREEMVVGSKVNVQRTTDENPMGVKAQRERKAGEIKVRDDW
jgi:hypothetical protein